MTSVDPLRMYLFEEGLVRFSTHKYTLRNLKCRYAHLTNYSLNKKSRHFVSNDDPEKDDVGSKWSLRALWDYLAKKGEDVRKVRREIAAVLVKTLIAAEAEITPITHRACPAKTECVASRARGEGGGSRRRAPSHHTSLAMRALSRARARPLALALARPGTTTASSCSVSTCCSTRTSSRGSSR